MSKIRLNEPAFSVGGGSTYQESLSETISLSASIISYTNGVIEELFPNAPSGANWNEVLLQDWSVGIPIQRPSDTNYYNPPADNGTHLINNVVHDRRPYEPLQVDSYVRYDNDSVYVTRGFQTMRSVTDATVPGGANVAFEVLIPKGFWGGQGQQTPVGLANYPGYSGTAMSWPSSLCDGWMYGGMYLQVDPQYTFLGQNAVWNVGQKIIYQGGDPETGIANVPVILMSPNEDNVMKFAHVLQNPEGINPAYGPAYDSGAPQLDVRDGLWHLYEWYQTPNTMTEVAGSGTVSVTGTAVTFSQSQTFIPGDGFVVGSQRFQVQSGSGTSWTLTKAASPDVSNQSWTKRTGNADGTLKLWLDNVLVTDRSDIKFFYGGMPITYTYAHILPIFGGGYAHCARDQWLRFGPMRWLVGNTP